MNKIGRFFYKLAAKLLASNDCISCGERLPLFECDKSKRRCGHHCNHAWGHDQCDWCGATW